MFFANHAPQINSPICICEIKPTHKRKRKINESWALTCRRGPNRGIRSDTLSATLINIGEVHPIFLARCRCNFTKVPFFKILLPRGVFRLIYCKFCNCPCPATISGSSRFLTSFTESVSFECHTKKKTIVLLKPYLFISERSLGSVFG